jgi:quinol monooxygenase YgiN
MSKYGLHGRLRSRAGSNEKLAQILLEASRLVSHAKGCRLYLISRDKNDDDSIWVTEVWDSKEDHDNSLNADDIKSLISQAMPLIEGRPEKGQELDILGGTGINIAE